MSKGNLFAMFQPDEKYFQQCSDIVLDTSEKIEEALEEKNNVNEIVTTVNEKAEALESINAILSALAIDPNSQIIREHLVRNGFTKFNSSTSVEKINNVLIPAYEGFLTDIWDKIIEFFSKLINWLTGNGWKANSADGEKGTNLNCAEQLKSVQETKTQFIDTIKGIASLIKVPEAKLQAAMILPTSTAKIEHPFTNHTMGIIASKYAEFKKFANLVETMSKTSFNDSGDKAKNDEEVMNRLKKLDDALMEIVNQNAMPEQVVTENQNVNLLTKSTLKDYMLPIKNIRANSALVSEIKDIPELISRFDATVNSYKVGSSTDNDISKTLNVLIKKMKADAEATEHSSKTNNTNNYGASHVDLLRGYMRYFTLVKDILTAYRKALVLNSVSLGIYVTKYLNTITQDKLHEIIVANGQDVTQVDMVKLLKDVDDIKRRTMKNVLHPKSKP